MAVSLNPDLQARLDRYAEQSGESIEHVVEEVMTAYFAEIDHLIELAESRLDDLESGKVQAIEGKEAMRMIRERAETRHKRTA